MSLINLLNQTITHYPKSGLSADGRETYGAGVEYLARFQPVSRNRLTRTLNNTDVILIEAIAYLDGEPDININDKITYDSGNYKVHGRSKAVDGQGNVNNTKLELKKWV